MSTLKGKNLLPVGANSYLLGKTSFWNVSVGQEDKQEAMQFIPIVKLAENLQNVSSRLKISVLRSLNRKEGNDQESIQLPKTFRPGHQRKVGRT